MNEETIRERVESIRRALPPHVKLEAACKTRTAEEVKAAADAGVDFLGYNHVQEALAVFDRLVSLYGEETARGLALHLIGPLQKNKIRKALSLFTMIETVESFEKAVHIDKRAVHPVDVLLQVNIGGEESKSGVDPAAVTETAEKILTLPRVRLRGLMTIEPYRENPEESRPYFKRMKVFFEELRERFGPGIEHLSMGMTHNYPVAVEEGATIVRIGTGIFGPRRCSA